MEPQIKRSSVAYGFVKVSIGDWYIRQWTVPLVHPIQGEGYLKFASLSLGCLKAYYQLYRCPMIKGAL